MKILMRPVIYAMLILGCLQMLACTDSGPNKQDQEQEKVKNDLIAKDVIVEIVEDEGKPSLIISNSNKKLEIEFAVKNIFDDKVSKTSFLTRLNDTPQKITAFLVSDDAKKVSFVEVPSRFNPQDTLTLQAQVNTPAGDLVGQTDVAEANIETQDTLTDIDQPYVARWACCENLPLIKSLDVPDEDLFAEENIAGYLTQNESVAVFDNAPIYRNQQLFVRIQRSKKDRSWGYFPLFWLHQKSSPVIESQLRVNASYMGIAKQLYNLADKAAYDNCDFLHPWGGPSTSAPPKGNGKDYECGEFPIGNTNQLITLKGHEYKHLTNIDKEIPAQTVIPKNENIEYPQFGWKDSDGGNIDLSFPFYMGRISKQNRDPKEYTLASLTDPGYYFDTRIYAQYEVAENDEPRLHPMDWYFKTWYPEESAANSDAVHFRLVTMMPGFEVYSPTFAKEVILWYEGAVLDYRDIRTESIRLGGMRLSELPIVISGRILAVEDSDDDGDINQLVPKGFGSRVRVEFTDVEFLRPPKMTFVDGIQIKFTEGGLLPSVIDHFINVFNAILLNEDVSNNILWKAVQPAVEDMILDQLVLLMPYLEKSFALPSSIAKRGCENIFPSAYKSFNSLFYGLYKNCLSIADSAEFQGFENPSDVIIDSKTTAYGESRDHYAQVSPGGFSWSSPSDKQKFLWCPGDQDDNCQAKIERPWWAEYNPRDDYIGGPKGANTSYSYRWDYGVTVRMRAKASMVQDYWHAMRCIVPAADRSFNYSPNGNAQIHQQRLREECFIPMLDTLCELYGESEDLLNMWSERYDSIPTLSGYTSYCKWAKEEKQQDTPDFAAG